MSKGGELKPFTKWVGGKRQILDVLKSNMPKEYGTYYEPMVGGGALFFSVAPKKAVINDLNNDLILSYKTIRDEVGSLIRILEEHSDNNSKEYYYDIRLSDRDGRYEKMTDVEKSARLLYMLRVNFNGMYRVNKNNQFNVPYGRYKNPNIVNESLLRSISKFLNESKITILNKSFEEVARKAKKGDFIYFDPPYVPLNQTSNFTSYTADGFGHDDQVLLRDTFKELDNRGCYVMLSNSNSPLVHELYAEYKDNILLVDAKRVINSDASKRGNVKEVIVKNY